ncbi:MAG: glycosyltransferase, partial [Planctomycetota bacterium]
MSSLIELVEQVNRGEPIEPSALDVYHESSNSAEKFLAHHAAAQLGLRRSQQHILQALEAIDYADQKVLGQFLSVCGFLGMSDMRCGPVVKFGSSAINRREYALGIEAIGNGLRDDLASGGEWARDRTNATAAAWEYDRAAEGIGWTTDADIHWNNRLTRIAYITSQIADDDPATQTALAFARNADTQRFKIFAYGTEAGVRREGEQFKSEKPQPSSNRRGLKSIDAFDRAKVRTWLAPTDGDAQAAAQALAEQLIADQIDVVLIDADLGDPIAALISSWNVARVKINIARRAPLYTKGIDGVAYFDAVGFEQDKSFWSEREIEACHILEGIDPQATKSTAPSRSTYGIPESATVLATAIDDPSTISEPFVESVIDVLRAHPHAVFLLIGGGDFGWQKKRFEAAGVAKRVGYTGKRRDLPGFLKIADVYLAEFPSASATGVLQAMSVEKPVVALQWGDSPEHSTAAALVGSEATINGRDTAAYIERVCKFIRDTG